MIAKEQTQREIVAYRLKLYALAQRFEAGERSQIAVEAQQHADALGCLMEESPIEQREAIDYLVDRYEALRIASVD
jgi:hypothetical protein